MMDFPDPCNLPDPDVSTEYGIPDLALIKIPQFLCTARRYGADARERLATSEDTLEDRGAEDRSLLGVEMDGFDLGTEVDFVLLVGLPT